VSTWCPNTAREEPEQRPGTVDDGVGNVAVTLDGEDT
jgi:hypothetical protein